MGVLIAVVIVPVAVTTGDEAPHLRHTVARENVVISLTEQGTVESSNNTEITCEVRGINTVTWVIPGGTVIQERDELVRLDTKVVETRLDVLERSTKEIELETLRADLTASRSKLAADEVGLKMEMARPQRPAKS